MGHILNIIFPDLYISSVYELPLEELKKGDSWACV